MFYGGSMMKQKTPQQQKFKHGIKFMLVELEEDWQKRWRHENWGCAIGCQADTWQEKSWLQQIWCGKDEISMQDVHRICSGHGKVSHNH